MIFNYGCINWQTFQALEASSQQFLDCLEDCFLTQHVSEPTTGDSVPDLVITDEPSMVDGMNVYGQFSTSDQGRIQRFLLGRVNAMASVRSASL